MTREEIVNSMSLQDAIQVLKDTNCYGTMDIAKTVILKALEQEPCTDAISRKAVLDAISSDRYDYSALLEYVKQLSPVTPQYTDAEIQRMQELEQAEIQKAYELGKAEMQPCEDAISRDKAIVQLNHLLSDWDDDWNVAIRKCIETIKIVQPVAPQPKMGRWIRDTITDLYHCSECRSICHQDPKSKDDYCKYCGAKMQEVEG